MCLTLAPPLLTAVALNSISVTAGELNGTLATKLEWDTIITWSVEEVVTIAEGEWPQNYTDNVEGNSSWVVGKVSMCPENTAFYFSIQINDEEGDDTMLLWLGYRTTNTVVFEHIATLTDKETNQTAIVGLDSSICLLAYQNGSNTNVDRYDRGKDGTFSPTQVLDTSYFIHPKRVRGQRTGGRVSHRIRRDYVLLQWWHGCPHYT